MSAKARQHIEIIRDDVDRLLDIFDTALALREQLNALGSRGIYADGGSLVTINEALHPHARYAANLWAQAHKFEREQLDDRFIRYSSEHGPVVQIMLDPSLAERKQEAKQEAVDPIWSVAQGVRP